MEALRREVFERDGYRCQHLLGWIKNIPYLCYNPVTWESGHIAHIIRRSQGGDDTAENTLCKCADCHLIKEHHEGGNGKIVPAKV